MVLLYQVLFFLAPDFSLVSGACDSQRLVLPVKNEERKAPRRYLLFFHTLCLQLLFPMQHWGQAFLSVPFAVYVVTLSFLFYPFYPFTRFNARSALVFLAPSLHDQTTFAKQPTYTTPWQCANFQGWSRLFKGLWGKFCNLSVLPVPELNCSHCEDI